jgi:transcription-repair coupling factor (superfamily II helicase)
LSLYKELDNIETEEGLMAFQENLIDRFGPLPREVSGLMNALRMRWAAKKIGFEKIVLRNHRLTGFFISNQESAYYSSAGFMSLLRFVQSNPGRCRMKEARDKLSLTFTDVNSAFDGLELLKELLEHGIKNRE